MSGRGRCGALPADPSGAHHRLQRINPTRLTLLHRVVSVVWLGRFRFRDAYEETMRIQLCPALMDWIVFLVLFAVLYGAGERGLTGSQCAWLGAITMVCGIALTAAK